MRVFWIIVACLVVVGVGIPVVHAYQQHERAEAQARVAAAEAAATEAAAREAERVAREAEAARARDAAPRAVEAPRPQVEAPAPAPRTEPVGAPIAAGADAPSTQNQSLASEPAATPAAAPAPETKPEASKSVPATDTPKPSGTPDAPAGAAVAKPSDAPVPSAAKAPSNTPGAPSAQAADKAGTPDASLAASVVRKDDGTLLVDDKYIVKGEGTKDKPYEVSWDMLVSAQETYDPRQGRKRLPGRLTMLNDKYVKLTGYIAYPLFVEEPRELLSMLNQWDGCCIGVPPTPYDAVEVHLAEPASKEQHAAIYGSVVGKFAVKPYLAGDWLVGLYVMENAKFDAQGFGGN